MGTHGTSHDLSHGTSHGWFHEAFPRVTSDGTKPAMGRPTVDMMGTPWGALWGTRWGILYGIPNEMSSEVYHGSTTE